MGQRHSFCYPEGQALLPAEWAQRLTLCALSTTWKRRARIETSGTTVNVAGLAIAVLQLEAALDAPPLYDNRRAKTAACSQELQGSGLVIPFESDVLCITSREPGAGTALARSGGTLTIPVGTHFQFRSFGYEPLSAIGVTMPPWPGDGEAIVVQGKWEPTV